MTQPGRVLVTGAAGFIGSHIVEAYATRGWRVLAMVHRRENALWSPRVREGAVSVLKSDLTDADRLRRDVRAAIAGDDPPDVLVHAAGRASDVGRRDAFRALNLDAVRHVAELARETGIERLVHISTTDVCGLRDFAGETEDRLPRGMTLRNPYPEFKIRAEEWLEEHVPREHRCILRPAAVWGPGDTTLTPRIVDFLRMSPVIVHFGPAKGRNRWPLAHVRTVATAAFLAGTRPDAAGRTFTVADSEHTTVDEFYRILAEVYLPKRRFRTLCLPIPVGLLLAAPVTAISNALNLDHPFMDPSVYALFSVSRNLDFANDALRTLFDQAGERLVTREEGIAELRREAAKTHR